MPAPNLFLIYVRDAEAATAFYRRQVSCSHYGPATASTSRRSRMTMCSGEPS